VVIRPRHVHIAGITLQASIVGDNLDELKLSNGRRLTALALKGHGVQGLLEGYHTRLLEHLVGDALPEVQAAHELWTAEQLDKVEKMIREQSLLTGVRGTKP
jgi:hypothetical protein